MDIFNIFKKNKTPVERVITKYIRTPVVPHQPPKAKDPEGMYRGFDAANSNNLNADWFAPQTQINQILKTQLPLLRSRSRERMRNDDYANSFKKLYVTNVVGPNGVKIQSLVKNYNGKRDDLAVNAIEVAWNNWAKYKDNVDIAGRENWKDMLTHLCKVFVTDGEVFIRHIEGNDTGKFGYAVQLIDPELCDVAYNTTWDAPLPNGNHVILGVEVNKWNKPIAYYFINGDINSQVPGARHIRVEASNILHYFLADFPNQVRGIPPLAPGIQRLKMLAGFENAALTNATVSAAKMGFYYRDGDDVSPGVEDADGELVDEVEPGQFVNLPAGTRFESFDSQYPDGEVAPFKKSMLRAIASGLGIDYPSFGNDLEAVNLASARVAINETREMWKGVQENLIDNIITPVYERWLINALMRKQITVMGKPLSIANIEKYKMVAWMPRRWAWPNPLQDSKAAETMMNHRIKAPSTVAKDQGLDFDMEVEKMSRDEQLLKDAGLTRITPTSVGMIEDNEESEMIKQDEKESSEIINND